MINEHYSIFSYMYRDYANFKQYNELLLRGAFTEKDVEDSICGSLWHAQYFIAEHVGIPPLHQDLWKLNGGKNQDDLPWHTFIEMRRATEEEVQSLPCWGTTKDLIDRFSSIDIWDISLSAYAQAGGCGCEFGCNFFPDYYEKEHLPPQYLEQWKHLLSRLEELAKPTPDQYVMFSSRQKNVGLPSGCLYQLAKPVVFR